MAFVLDQSGTYSWPVAFELPVDGGKHRRVTFEVVFNRQTQDRVEQILAAQQQLMRAAQRADEDLLEKLAIGRQHAEEIMAGWSGVKASDDAPDDLEFTPANVRRFLQVPGMAAAVLKAFGESLQLGKEKN